MTRSALDFAAVDAVFGEFWASSPAPGLAYGVVADGELVHFRGLGGLSVGGPAPSPDSVFRIASMTKSFTAACLLALRDEGVLALDDPAARHVPELAALHRPTTDSPSVTLRHLATMTSGLPTDDPWADRLLPLERDGFDAVLAPGLRFARAPGVGFEYSNLSYALLGRAIGAASGGSYAAAVTDRLLRPLGLAATVFEPRGLDGSRLATGHRRRFPQEDADAGDWVALPFAAHGEFAAMGGLYSSVADLARWIGELTDAFPARDGDETGHPLRRASRREMQRAQCIIPDAPVGPGGVLVGGYGLGLAVAHDPARGDLVGHPGGLPGFGSAMRWHPASGLGVVALLNSTYAPAEQPVMAALDALVARGSLGPEPLWPETLAARDDVVRLLEEWDDALAVRLFAGNVGEDRVLELRREEVARLRERLGALSLDPEAETRSVSPAQLTWWMRAPGGRLRVSISLTPTSPPTVQTLEITLDG